MISQLTIIGLYMDSFMQLLLITLALVLLRRTHKYSLTSVILGVAIYFLCSEMLTTFTFQLIASIEAVGNFLTKDENILLYYAFISLLSSVYVAPVAYAALKHVRKGKWNIYEAMAAGMSYWFYSTVTSSYNYINEARIAQMANDGTISSLISETITQADIDSYLATLKTATLTSCLAQIAFFSMVLAMMTAMMILIYHGVKRKKSRVIWIGIAVPFLIQFGAYSLSLTASWIYLLYCLLMTGVLVFAILRYFAWYRAQQAYLLRQKKEFKQRRQEEYKAKVAEKERLEQEAKEKERFRANLEAAAAAELALRDQANAVSEQISDPTSEQTADPVSEQTSDQ